VNARKDEGTEGRKDDVVVGGEQKQEDPPSRTELGNWLCGGVLSGLYSSCWFWDRVRNG
jgi:hypothetical protein